MISPVTTILLLDDDPLLRRATALILSRQGGLVTPAATGDEAVVLTHEHLYDVAVFDVSPAGPSAADLLRRIRAGGLVPRRVIAVSNAPLPLAETEELTEVLLKPYPFESLLHAVFGAGGRPRTRSGVFARAGSPAGGLTGRAPRGAARAGRGRAG